MTNEKHYRMAVTLPKDLRDFLKALAAEERRSMHAQLLVLITQAKQNEQLRSAG